MISMTNQAWLLAASEQVLTADKPLKGIPETYYKRYTKSQLMKAKALPLNFDVIKGTYNGHKIKYPVYLLTEEGARVTAEVQTNIDGDGIRTYWRKGCAIGIEVDPNKETFDQVDLVMAFPVKRRMKPRQVVQKMVHSGLVEHVCTSCKSRHYTDAPMAWRDSMLATLCLQGIHSQDKPISHEFSELILFSDFTFADRYIQIEGKVEHVRFYNATQVDGALLAVVLDDGLDNQVYVRTVLADEAGRMAYHLPSAKQPA